MAATMSASFVCQGSVKAAPASTSRVTRASSSCYQQKMSSFGGLKAANCLTSLGSGQSVEQQFAKLQAQCRLKCKSRRGGGGGGGGALLSKASVSEEVFRVVPIMSVLVLVGVAVGFLLLRVEQALDEAEDG